MAGKKQKADCRADTRGGGFAGIPVCVIESPAYRSLSLWARAVLVELAARMRGYNNGSVALSVTEICDALGNSNRRKASAALAELMNRGLIDMGADALWKERKAREYRLTFVSVKRGHFIEPASNEYLKWTPEEKIRGNASSPEGGQSGNASSPEPDSVGNASSPSKFTDLRKTAKNAPIEKGLAGNDVSLLISKPYPIQTNPPVSNTFDPIMEGLRESWLALGSSQRTAIARRHAISGDEVEGLLAGRVEIGPAKLISLRAAAVRAVQTAGAARAG
jgi:hypothetical protein